jgi:hypothetical protein
MFIGKEAYHVVCFFSVLVLTVLNAVMKQHPKFAALVEQIKALIDFISKDKSLGDSFRIDRSYLCKQRRNYR